jgi:flagellar hook-basal body complex protein FliE
MVEKINSPANIQAMLQVMRAYEAQASAEPQAAMLEPASAANAKMGFGALVQGAITQVNAMQLESRALQSAYDSGQPVPLTDVVQSMQKSSLAFETTLQIRNRVLKAYEEILNMPV